MGPAWVAAAQIVRAASWGQGSERKDVRQCGTDSGFARCAVWWCHFTAGGTGSAVQMWVHRVCGFAKGRLFMSGPIN